MTANICNIVKITAPIVASIVKMISDIVYASKQSEFDKFSSKYFNLTIMVQILNYVPGFA